MHRKFNYFSLDVFTIATIIYLFLGRQAPWNIYLKGIRIVLVLSFFLAGYYFLSKLPTRKTVSISIWILLSLSLLGAYLLSNYGHQEDTLTLFLNYLFSFGLFLIAFYFGIRNKKKILKTGMFVLVFLTTLLLIPFAITGLTIGDVDKSFSGGFFGFDNPLIIYWPFVFILGTAGFSFVFFNGKLKTKIIAFTFLLFLIIALIVSSFTAVFFMIIITFLAYYFLIFSKKKFFVALFFVSVSLIAGITLLNLVANESFGELGGTSKKVQAFLNLQYAESARERENLLTIATSDRWRRLDFSIESFLSSPVYGKGYEWNKFPPIVSGHSSLIDNLAFFGIFSFFFFMIYFSFTIKAFRLTKLSVSKSEYKANALLFGLLLSFLLINLVNPYFYHATLNELVFFLGGWVSGQEVFLDKKKIMV